MSNIVYKCKACGAVIKLEEKFCRNCGAENVLRIQEIVKLQSKVKRVEKKREKVWGGRTPDRKGTQRDGATELHDLALARRSRELKMRKTKLKTGNTHRGIPFWR